MKGDFSRDTFNSKKNFSRVLSQQGRVSLDADWNEQSAILLHYIRTLAADLIGPHAGPEDGFKVELKDGDLLIHPGRYYVDGILCENSATRPVNYLNQPSYKPEKSELPKAPYLIYLDVWERHVTAFEDESLREVALGDIDTTTRAQVVWQVKLRTLPILNTQIKCEDIKFQSNGNALLQARTEPAQKSEDPCNIEPDARYRGAENQLYRVEIHRGNVDENGEKQDATFKWSRENGSVMFPIMSIAESGGTTEVRLTNLGRDDKSSLREGDWVEVFDDNYTLGNRADNLLQIISIDRDEMSVSLNSNLQSEVSEKPENHPLMRRWDQKAGNPNEGGLVLDADDNAAEIVEGHWLKLEDGVQIRFLKESGTIFRTGDYWLIPARTATGDVEWEEDAAGQPAAKPPLGIEHHYAPLGIVKNSTITHCRKLLEPISAFKTPAPNDKLKPVSPKDKPDGKPEDKKDG